MSEQRKIIHDDNNGLDYVLVGDYYIPMLALPEENRPIGYWGICLLYTSPSPRDS